MVGASKLKDQIEKGTLKSFGNDIIKYNDWTNGTHEQTIKEEGNGYSEYMGSMFKAYLACDHSEFSEMVKSENRLSTHGNLADT